jgi:hypothetical protein
MRKLVARESAPAESNLGEVSRSHYDAMELIGFIEEKLRTVAGLHILKNYVFLAAMPQVPEVRLDAPRDVHFFEAYPKGTA